MVNKTTERFQTLRKMLIMLMGGRCQWVNGKGESCTNDFGGDVMNLEFHHLNEKPKVYGRREYYIIQQIWEFGRSGKIPSDIRLFCACHHKLADKIKRGKK